MKVRDLFLFVFILFFILGIISLIWVNDFSNDESLDLEKKSMSEFLSNSSYIIGAFLNINFNNFNLLVNDPNFMDFYISGDLDILVDRYDLNKQGYEISFFDSYGDFNPVSFTSLNDITYFSFISKISNGQGYVRLLIPTSDLDFDFSLKDGFFLIDFDGVLMGQGHFQKINLEDYSDCFTNHNINKVENFKGDEVLRVSSNSLENYGFCLVLETDSEVLIQEFSEFDFSFLLNYFLYGFFILFLVFIYFSFCFNFKEIKIFKPANYFYTVGNIIFVLIWFGYLTFLIYTFGFSFWKSYNLLISFFYFLLALFFYLFCFRLKISARLPLLFGFIFFGLFCIFELFFIVYFDSFIFFREFFNFPLIFNFFLVLGLISFLIGFEEAIKK